MERTNPTCNTTPGNYQLSGFPTFVAGSSRAAVGTSCFHVAAVIADVAHCSFHRREEGFQACILEDVPRVG